jgi:V/A-type H+-transporting ATPase subunit I
MIATMKKVFLVTLDHRKEETLSQLKEMGVLHLEEIHGYSEHLEELQKQKARVARGLTILPPDKPEEETTGPSGEKLLEEALEISRRLEQLADERHSHNEAIERLNREIERVTPVGDFDPGDLEYLREKGLDLRLFIVTKDDWARFPQDLTTFVVRSGKSLSHVAVLVPEGRDLSEFLEFEAPKKSLTEMEKEREEHRERVAKIDGEIESLNGYTALLERADSLLAEEIEFENVRAGMEKEETLAYLAGWVPEQYVDRLKKHATEEGLALIVRDPQPDENPPTLVENPKAVRIIQPVFDFLGTVPGYREYDISFFFLLFLTVFFAMIVGDAGYGLLFLGAAGFSARKQKQKTGAVPDIHKLLILMSASTIVWGVLSGTYFGSRALAQAPFFSAFVVEGIASFGSEISEPTIKHICFIIGTVQIAIAHLMNFLKEIHQRPKIRAFAQLGWLSMVLGLYYVVLNLVINAVQYPIPQYALYMIFGGLAAVFLFSEQEGNFFKGILKALAGFMPKILDSISAFTDIISYIRLFAVGLATVEIAKSFNAMAADMGSTLIGLIGGAIILLIGHALNIAMAALSVVVHGVRLNMLEFSSHLGMEWVGVPYDPFRHRIEKE